MSAFARIEPGAAPSAATSELSAERESRLELHCAACGYALATGTPPSVCPLCGDQAWAPTLWRPFSRPGSPPLSR